MALRTSDAGRGRLVFEAGPSRSASGASWFAGGMLAPWCERESAEAAVVELGRLSADWWDAALPGLVQRHGTLVVAPPRDAAELGRFASRTTALTGSTATCIATLEPDLEGRFRQGPLLHARRHISTRRAALSRLHGRLGEAGVPLPLRRRRNPQRRSTTSSTAPAWRRATFFRPCAVCAARCFICETQDVRLSRPVRLLHPRIPLYVVPRGDGRFMVGATMIESDDRGPVTARSLMELLNAAYALHPAFGEGAGGRDGRRRPPSLHRQSAEHRTQRRKCDLSQRLPPPRLPAGARHGRSAVADMIGKTETAHARDRQRRIARDGRRNAGSLMIQLGYEGGWFATAVNGDFVPLRTSATRRCSQMATGIEILTADAGRLRWRTCLNSTVCNSARACCSARRNTRRPQSFRRR
jgi:glycine oxidase